MPSTRTPTTRLVRRRIRIAAADVRFMRRDKTTGLPTEFSAVVMRYNVIDDYGTRFVPGVFDLSMQARMPRICWAHDWTNPVGRWVEVVENNSDLLELRAELDDFDDVPDARRTASQLASGTIDQFSVGFYLEEEREAEDPKLHGIWDITKGELVEASPVLLGAVPGTALTGMRSTPSGLLVPLEDVERIIVNLGAGTVDVVDAIQGARELASGEAEPEREATAVIEPEIDVQPEAEAGTVDPDDEQTDPDDEPEDDAAAFDDDLLVALDNVIDRVL